MVRLLDYHGITAKDEEDLLRWTWFGFLNEIQKQLLLPNASIQTAAVYTHRFFQKSSYDLFSKTSYERHSMKVVACAALLLTGKHRAHSHSEYIEPVTVEKVLPIAFRLTYPICNDTVIYQAYESEIWLAGQELTQAIGPDFYIDLPFTWLSAGLQTMQPQVNFTLTTIHRATAFIHRTYATTICTKYTANQIGAAGLQLSAEEDEVLLISRFENKQWYEGMGCTQSDVQDVYAAMSEAFDQMPDFGCVIGC